MPFLVKKSPTRRFTSIDDARRAFAGLVPKNATRFGALRRQTYRELCKRMDHRNANITKVVRACVLGPNAVAEYVQLNETAPKLQNESPTVLRNAENYGAVLFRAGRFEEALQQFVKSCERGVKPIQMNLSWYMRAMTHKQLEQESEAIAWLEKADAAADALFALGHQVDWRDRSEVKIFSERSSRAHSRYQSKNAKRYD